MSFKRFLGEKLNLATKIDKHDLKSNHEINNLVTTIYYEMPKKKITFEQDSYMYLSKETIF